MFQNCGSSTLRFSAKGVHTVHIEGSLSLCWNANHTYKNPQTQAIT
jgi:hypothetical protein